MAPSENDCMLPHLVLTLGPGLESSSHGDLVRVDWRTKRIVDHARYEHRVYEESHKGLTGASWNGSKLVVATEVELLEYDVCPFRLVEARTFPFLNDVHHLAAANGRIWVCNTGLDCVEEFDADWRLVRTHDLIRAFGRRRRFAWELMKLDARKSWDRMTGRRKMYGHLKHRPAFRNLVKLAAPAHYRRNGRDLRDWDFRPHVLHPNHVLPREDDVWVTLWHTGEIVGLASGRIIADGLGQPHDGIVVDGDLYATDCRGNRLIVVRDVEGPRPERRELRVTATLAEGFLRGVAVCSDLVFVGLTARRGSDGPFRSARVVALDRTTLERVETWSVPDELGTSIYSILPAQ